jgi:alkylation response protein AidB-like acyl-CoA dehydrogenase
MIDLNLSSDQLSLQAVALDLFRSKASIAQVRRAETLGFDEELWSTIISTGFSVMGLPIDVGGSSATPMDLAVIAQEYGRALAPIPLVEAVVAGNLLARLGAGDDLLTSVVTGGVLPTIALRPVIGTVAELVPAGAIADLVVVYREGKIYACQRIDKRPYGPAMANLGDLPIANWRLDDGKAVILADGERARESFADSLSEWKLLTAAALNGLRERALEIGVEYVKQRHAFGVPLGWFQAVQHRLADDAASGDGARLLMFEAAWARGQAKPNASALASMAFLYGAETAFETCKSSLQFHGGYGFTLEYDIQLFFRRAKAWPLVAGPIRDHYQVLADQLFGEMKEFENGL